MKREGRQHGLVRTRAVLPRPGARVAHLLTSPPTAGVFTRATSKPTNHSKFTGRCGRQACADCHGAPTSKSRCKVKGERKAAGAAALALGLELGRYGEDSATEVANRLLGSWRDDYDDEIQDYGCTDDWSHRKSNDDSVGFSDVYNVWTSDEDDYEYPVKQQRRGEFAFQLAHATHDDFAGQLNSVMRDPGGVGLAAATAAAATADVEDWLLVEPDGS